MMNTFLVCTEMLGEVKFLVNDRLTINREIIGGVGGVSEYIHVLTGEILLPGPVSKSLYVTGLEKMVETPDDLPLEISH